MRITEQKLRRIIREELEEKDKEIIRDVAEVILSLRDALDNLDEIPDDDDLHPAALKDFFTAYADFLKYEGLEIGNKPDEMAALLEETGMSKDELGQVFERAEETLKIAEEMKQVKPTAEPSTRAPAGATKMSADVRVVGRAGPSGVTTSMFVQLGSGGSYRLDVPNSWDGATVGSNAPALRIGDITYHWVLGGYLGIFMSMIGTNGTHWYLIDEKGLYKLPSLSAAQDLADQIKR
jgi:Asp-tRNA(Asn)/Glu-tRNA(Gln) amidotransferase C subunit